MKNYPKHTISSLLALAVLVSGCSDHQPANQATADFDDTGPMNPYQGKPASQHTIDQLESAPLPIGDFTDGTTMMDHNQDRLVAKLPQKLGIVDYAQFKYLHSERPDSVHPSLFSASRDTYEGIGLFEVMEGVYQIRADLAYVTLVRGGKGWIVLDAGTSRQFIEDVWPFVHERLPGGLEVPVSTVVYSHSHVDHFGGVKGFIEQADVDAGKVEVIAPHGFMAEALAENVIAGSAMLRRAQYHFGAALDNKPDGSEFVSLGVALKGSTGEFTLIAPTTTLPAGRGIITERVVDGVPMLFKDISQAEAPAATLIYLPKQKLLFNSELVYRGLHNIYTLRGAQVRDALGWSKLINEVLHEWGDTAEYILGPHGPAFSGNERIKEYLRVQRDNYGFIHNQTLRLINSGMKMQDVGQAIVDLVPTSLSELWHTRGYHGTYSHNARGVVNRYIGFYDGNPANLNPLPLKQEAEHFVRYMGGADSILVKAKQDFEGGEYRLVASVLNKLVTAEPNHWPARHLLADAFEQLGYQSEGPQWRNAYLTAAKELRIGDVLEPAAQERQVDLLSAATIEDLLDSVAVKVNAEKAEGETFTLQIVVPDDKEVWFVELSNGNLSYIKVSSRREADTTLTVNRSDLLRLLNGQLGIGEIASLGSEALEGSIFTMTTLLGVLDRDDQFYDMVPMPE